ncbi:MAG: hypothetical protein ABIN89_29790 [Chitinophagaceae bacterium]
MKKLLLLLIITASVTTYAVAQEQKDAKTDRTEWQKKLTDELKFTPEQTEKFNGINKEYNEKIDAVMADASANQDTQKEKKMALKKEKEAKIIEFLTPEQQTKYKELMDKKMKEMSSKPKA